MGHEKLIHKANSKISFQHLFPIKKYAYIISHQTASFKGQTENVADPFIPHLFWSWLALWLNRQVQFDCMDTFR